jgi:hypothetical protein
MRDRKPIQRFIHSPGPGEYIFNTCVRANSEFVLDGVPERGKSGWKKRKWLSVWTGRVDRTHTNESGTGAK